MGAEIHILEVSNDVASLTGITDNATSLPVVMAPKWVRHKQNFLAVDKEARTCI